MYFKNKGGKPYEMNDGQCEIFYTITSKFLKWCWISAPTRFGKSETASIALLYLAVFHKLKIVIIGGTTEKANKIMEYVVEHIADHPSLHNGLINAKDIDMVDKLKIQASKTALRWSHGGWIYITSVDTNKISAEGEKAVGEGADIVFIEESPLIKRKEQISKIMRMPESDRGWGKLVQAGNMIEGNHFEEAYKSDLYYKCLVSLEQAMKDKGWTEEEIQNKMDQMITKDKKRYYLMKFPKRGEATYFKPFTYDILPKIVSYVGAIDPALGKTATKESPTKKSTSNTAIVVLGRAENGQLFEIFSRTGKIKPKEAMSIILNFPYEFDRFVVEDVQFQQFFREMLDDKSKEYGKYIPFEGITQQRAKEARIESMEPKVNTGIILFKKDSDVYNELVDYPNGDYMDGIDATEMAYRTIKIDDWAPI